MAVVVDPGRLDPHHRGDEGGEKHRFEIETVEHGPLYDARRCVQPASTCAAAAGRPTSSADAPKIDGPIVNISWLPPIVVETSERLFRALSLADLTQGATVWLAVTGLSRSGKTVFTTSLIHNLLSSLHNPNRMPLLNVVGERRLIAAKLEGAKANRLPRFPYAANIETMAGIVARLAGAHRPTSARSASTSISCRPAPSGRLLSEISGNAGDA